MKLTATAATCVALTFASACHVSVRANPNPAERNADSLYASAIADLHTLSSIATLDTATLKLERYLASPVKIDHRAEAEAMLRLARDAQRLSHVEAALQQAKATVDDKTKDSVVAKKSDDEAVKEIQRLKDELAKANEELERIKKRLAAPKP